MNRLPPRLDHARRYECDCREDALPVPDGQRAGCGFNHLRRLKMHLRHGPHNFVAERRHCRGRGKDSAMKSMAMLVAAAAAAMTASVSSALSQEVCSKAYLSCVNACVEQPKAAQDSCMSACQTRNDRCSDEIYGGRRESDPAPEAKEAKPGKRAASPHKRKSAAARPKLDATTRKVQGAFPDAVPPDWFAPPAQAPAGERSWNR